MTTTPDMPDTDLRTPNQIAMYLHCKQCIEEASTQRTAPVDYARNSVGLTPDGGIQVWCERHQINVAKFGGE